MNVLFMRCKLKKNPDRSGFFLSLVKIWTVERAK